MLEREVEIIETLETHVLIYLARAVTRTRLVTVEVPISNSSSPFILASEDRISVCRSHYIRKQDEQSQYFASAKNSESTFFLHCLFN